MRRELAPGITVRASRIDGKGCFATVGFKRGRKIGELVGERVSRIEAARRMRGHERLHICAINSYWGIDGKAGGNGTEYINHSCVPNSYMKIIRGHILFFAKRDIKPGEEITLDYVESYHPDTKRCRCKAPSCRGTINLKKEK